MNNKNKYKGEAALSEEEQELKKLTDKLVRRGDSPSLYFKRDPNGRLERDKKTGKLTWNTITALEKAKLES